VVSTEEALVHERSAERGSNSIAIRSRTIRRFDLFVGISVRRPLRKNVRRTDLSVGVTAPSTSPVSRGGPTCSAAHRNVSRSSR